MVINPFILLIAFCMWRKLILCRDGSIGISLAYDVELSNEVCDVYHLEWVACGMNG